MGRGLVVACIVLLAGCVDTQSVTCTDGRVCPTDSVCDNVHALCVTTAQTTACNGLDEADRCTAGDFNGICDQGICIAGCGDGVQDGEACDDGNFASHDGCSSTCALESPAWVERQDGWGPRSRHAAAYLFTTDTTKRKLVVFGGTDDSTTTDEQWEQDTSQVWRPMLGARPPARQGAVMAYDELHEKIVLFGGRSSGGLLGDTWTYDGTAWTPVTQPGPSARYGAALAYAGNGKVVLFGGTDAGGPSAETWEFDGATSSWTKRLITGPSARSGHAMAWAAFNTNPRVVLFGGIPAPGGTPDPQTWEYTSGGTWTIVTPSPGLPTARYAATMAYLPSHTAVVMFGGNSFVASIPLSDTWEYNGTTWTAQTPAISPGGRIDATLTRDPLGVRLVGGAAGTGALDDTWLYLGGSGSLWDWRGVPGADTPRGEHELVYDPITHEMNAIAGFREPGPRNEMFSFDGLRWVPNGLLAIANVFNSPSNFNARYRFASTFDVARGRMMITGGLTGLASSPGYPVGSQVHTAAGWVEVPGPQPTHRVGGAMVYEDATQQVVLFGGANETGLIGETWVFDGSWSQLAISGPPPQERPAMAYDPVHERIVEFASNGETWAKTAAGWSKLTLTGDTPSARNGAVMVWHQPLRSVLMYGGTTTIGGEILGDMWQLTDEGWVKIVPVGETPPLRTDPRLVAYPPSRKLMLHAGTTASLRRLNDTWLFQFRSDTPEELCANGIDDDGDKRVDDRDDDCKL